MWSASLYLKDPAGARFVAGGPAEVELLLGSPLPSLPPPDREGGRSVFAVRFHPQLRTLLLRFLQGLLSQIGAEGAAPPDRAGRDLPRDQAEYEEALERLLQSVRAADRRLGLLNLCWLALTRDVAESLRELEAKSPAIKKAKYSLHPLLSSFYKRVNQSARRVVDRNCPGRVAFLAGTRENTALVDALLDDGFAFTELSISDVDFNQFLAANKRYRLSADVFFELYSILVRETERRLREGDRGLLARMARHLPDLPKEHWQTPAGAAKVMMNSHVLPYLLADAWTTGTRLMASARIKAEADKRRPAEIVDAFLDLVSGVKRFEILAHVRDQVTLHGPFGASLDDRVSKGLRLYEFGDSATVLNSAVNASVLFLDLRGFTKTSEGHISERDLTRELYTVFDEFVPHVRRFGGTVDKFLGDGIMVNYGTNHLDPLNPLNALRTAILCQETLQRMREEGTTYFKMGIAIHYGRVYIARFIADEEAVQTTVIGRNVNLAGRLSAGAKRPLDEDEEPDAAGGAAGPGMSVMVDATGTLFNEGIAISRDTLVQLESQLPLVQVEKDGRSVMEYFDEQISKRIQLSYAGDAKFKGVRSSFPVYAVSFEG
jgi:class 3 adenylate cyclase